jgi:hypothetical protein
MSVWWRYPSLCCFARLQPTLACSTTSPALQKGKHVEGEVVVPAACLRQKQSRCSSGTTTAAINIPWLSYRLSGKALLCIYVTFNSFL